MLADRAAVAARRGSARQGDSEPRASGAIGVAGQSQRPFETPASRAGGFLAAVLLSVPLGAQFASEASSPYRAPPSRQLLLPPPEATARLPPLGPDDLGQPVNPSEVPRQLGVSRPFPAGSVDGRDSTFTGAWEPTSAGTVWRLTIAADGARALRVHFAGADLGQGKLWVHDGNDVVFGPYQGTGPFGDGDFWTPVLRGDRVQVEYLPELEPVADERVPFQIVEIAHIWRPLAVAGSPLASGRSKAASRGNPLPLHLSSRKAWSRAQPLDGGPGPQPIAAGRPAGFRLAPDSSRAVLTGAGSYLFEVSPRTESVEIALAATSPDADADLFVRFGQDNEVRDGMVLTDHRSEGLGGTEVVVIDRNSDPPLRAGRYFVSIGAAKTDPAVEGTVMITPRFEPDSCFTDAVCHADNWGSVASGIALIAIAGDDGGQWGCSGSLLGSVAGSTAPLFLTAAHCIGSDYEARSVVAHWYRQNAACSGQPEPENRDPRYRTTAGSRLLAIDSGSLIRGGGITPYGSGDIALVELLEPPPDGVKRLGWDASAKGLARGGNVVGIHHADLLHKQIAFGRIVDRYRHMTGVSWGNGLTLGGASGSPLLDTRGRVLGVLSGGRSDYDGCFTSGSPAIYSNFRSFFPKVEALIRGSMDPSELIFSGGTLAPGRPASFQLPIATAGVLQNGSYSFQLRVPLDATGLTLSVKSDDPSVNVDVFIRRGANLGASQDAEWSGTTGSGNEEVVIGRKTDPPLRAGTYYIALRLDENAKSGATGTLEARLERGIALPLGMEFVPIPAGEFVMGSDRYGERPQTRVKISRAFELSRHEVTRDQWESVMGTPPPADDDCTGDCPVGGVSWNHVQQFVQRMNLIGDGFDYRLPTEAEWEYAARAGSTSDPYGPLDEIAWHNGNSGGFSGRAHPVGQKEPNAFGLHDMLGNASEWVADVWGDYGGGTVADPSGPLPDKRSWRVYRGCSYRALESYCRATARERSLPDDKRKSRGFRIARTAGSASGTSLGGNVATGEAATFVVGPELAGVLQADSHSYVLEVPTHSTWLVLKVQPLSPGVTLDLFVRFEADVGTEGEADWIATAGPSGTDLVIARHSDPPLRPGMYYVAVKRTDSLGSRARGRFSASVEFSGSPPGMEFAEVPPGSFWMGSEAEEADSDETPLTSVKITKGFELSRHEVTQGEWTAVMSSNPSNNDDCGLDCPVDSVSWEEVQAFVSRLNSVEDGYSYRLPTEAEWEYAARGGLTSERYGPLDEIAWHKENSGSFYADPFPVGQKTPNAFGLHDMLGNVSEWVGGWYGEYPGGSIVDPGGPRTGSYRVHRGGSVRDEADECRAAARETAYGSKYGSSDRGFRLLRKSQGSPRPKPGGALIPDQPAIYGIPAGQQGVLQSGQSSYRLEVPPAARWLSIELTAESHGAEFSVYVRRNADNSDTDSADWQQGPLREGSLLIGPFSEPPLRPGTYYISLLRSDELGSRASGSIVATLQSAGAPPGMEFSQIPAGEFLMGSENGPTWGKEDPVTRVVLTRAFELGRFEVTQGQWLAVMGSNPSSDTDCGPSCPVDSVTWHEVQEFARRLNTLADRYEYRLPTEAEWEYSARGGSSSDPYGPLDEVAWYEENSGGYFGSASPVGRKAANGFGLHDVLGNISEWTLDWLADYPGGAVTDPVGAEDEFWRGVRGGSYSDGVEECRSSARSSRSRGFSSRTVGFRLARVRR